MSSRLQFLRQRIASASLARRVFDENAPLNRVIDIAQRGVGRRLGKRRPGIHRIECGEYGRYTRFSPRDWSMKFNGEAVSISPSIGNWSFACQSHYILDGGRVHWADRWSRERIELGRLLDRERKERHYKGEPTAPILAEPKVQAARLGPLARFARWLTGK